MDLLVRCLLTCYSFSCIRPLSREAPTNRSAACPTHKDIHPLASDDPARSEKEVGIEYASTGQRPTRNKDRGAESRGQRPESPVPRVAVAGRR